MATPRCPYTHLGWSIDSSGLHRAFIEAAEADPEIEAYCLIDPRRHATGCRDALLEYGLRLRGMPDAIVLTARQGFAVEFAASIAFADAGSGDARRAVARWCAQLGADPDEERRGRAWRPVRLQAPLFWSWKRRCSPLSALLTALAANAAFVGAQCRPRPLADP